MTMRMWLLAGTVLVGIACCCGGEPASAQSTRGPSLEEQLLEDLRADPLDDEVHEELFAPEDGPAGNDARRGDSADGPGVEDLDAELMRELGPAAVSGDENPLVDVSRQMRSVGNRISQADSGRATQDMQKGIVSKLEELLEQVRKRCSGQPNPSQDPQQVASREPVSQPKQQKKPGEGGEKPSSKVPRDPQTKPGSGTGRRPDMAEMRDLIKEVWGQLPAAEREQMLELPEEEFLPKYELLIEAYFKRLVEEQQEVDRWQPGTAPPR